MNKSDMAPLEFFNNELHKNTSNLKDVKSRIRTVSLLRFITFVVTVIGFYVLIANGYEALSLLMLFGVGLFIYLVSVHLKLEKKKAEHEAAIKINELEIDRVVGNTAKHDGGNEYIIEGHPYSEDLDIFGKNSVFQLLNRTATCAGKDYLGRTLNEGIFNIPLLRDRQLAISELAKMPQWRQKFQVKGLLFDENKGDLDSLISWSKKPSGAFNTLFYKSMLIVNPIVGFGIITLIQMGILSFGAFFLFLLIPFILVGTKLSLLNKIHADVSKKSGLLVKYSSLFGLLINGNFKSDLLKKEVLVINGEKNAQMAIGQLAKITKSMDYRLNMLVGFFLNVFFLWDIRQSIKIQNWKSRYSEDLAAWFDSLALFDELQSLGGFAFIETESVFPKFMDKGFSLIGEDVKHPFINKNDSVGNTVTFNNWGEFHIITGANMAGKSTYLRTVGVNVILALTGTVVLANRFELTPVKVYTGIKTTDSLKEGESYFFAELLRLRNIIDTLESGEKLFIILDEVLRGTNSKDKQKGSMALVYQLIRLGSSGMIATHDLELGKLINEFPDNVSNQRFEVEINNGELEFDYKLKDGVSKNLNATFLMKKMGITL